MTLLIDENQNRRRSAKATSPLLVAAACLLSSFAARADGARPAATAAVATSQQPADGADAEAASPAQPAAGAFQQTAAQSSAQAPGPQAQDDGDDEAPPPPPPPPPPSRWRPRRRAVLNRDARSGPFFSLGLGGAQQYVSGAGHQGGIDTDLRMGYGFSDRLQMFVALGGSESSQDSYQNVAMWHLRLHAQTVLVGDRRGNGLNLNFGIGFGGASTNGYDDGGHDSSQVGLSLGAGLSYEARITPRFALAPEAFASWQQVPNYNGLPSDIGWTLGARLNFVWYSPF